MTEPRSSTEPVPTDLDAAARDFVARDTVAWDAVQLDAIQLDAVIVGTGPIGLGTAMVVDTHGGPHAQCLTLGRHTHPGKADANPQRSLPPRAWVLLHHAPLLHGHRACAAHKPARGRWAVAASCPPRAA